MDRDLVEQAQRGDQEAFAILARSRPTLERVTVVTMGRPDGDPSVARYGGSVELLKSILTTLDVWTPGPSQSPG